MRKSVGESVGVTPERAERTVSWSIDRQSRAADIGGYLISRQSRAHTIVGCSIARQSRAQSQEEKQQAEMRGSGEAECMKIHLERGEQAREWDKNGAWRISQRKTSLGARRTSKGERQTESNSHNREQLSHQWEKGRDRNGYKDRQTRESEKQKRICPWSEKDKQERDISFWERGGQAKERRKRMQRLVAAPRGNDDRLLVVCSVALLHQAVILIV
jgi:hypothetical protein